MTKRTGLSSRKGGKKIKREKLRTKNVSIHDTAKNSFIRIVTDECAVGRIKSFQNVQQTY